MLLIKNLTIKDLKNHILLEDFSFSLKDQDKIGIIGEEGNGKSTLLKAIYKQDDITSYTSISGIIDMDLQRIGYLPQRLPQAWEDTYIQDFLLKEHVDDEVAYEDYNDLSTLEHLCGRLHISPTIISSLQTMKTLSGGEKVKLQLLKLMKHPCDLYLLDEPTNDLDIQTLKWLELFIQQVTVPILFISHDETLLQNSANGILHLEQLNKKTKTRWTLYRGDYDDYVQERSHNLERNVQLASKEKQEYRKKKDKLNDIMNAVHDAQNTMTRQNPYLAQRLKQKMHTVKAMNQRIEQEGYRKVDSVEDSISVRFEPTALPRHKLIIDANVQVNIDERVLLQPSNLFIKASDKVGIIGNNGCGKTLLMKQLYEMLKMRDDIQLGYMPQQYMELIDEQETPVSFLLTKGDRDDVSASRELLGSAKLTSEEMLQPISALSEGQKAKVYLMRMIKHQCNVLLLDEPTRNLSPLTSPVIRSILQEYDGCIISISHDRKYLGDVCTRILEIQDCNMIEKDE